MFPTLVEPAWALCSMLLLVPLAMAPICLTIRRWHLIKLVIGGANAPLLRLRIKLGLVSLAMLLIALALGEPIFHAKSWQYDGRVDIVVVFDGSDSMGAEDAAGFTRMEFGSQIADTELRPAAKNNQMGVVTFADDPQEHAFLTSDQRFLHWTIVRTVRMGSAAGGGSFISKGLRRALELFHLDSKPDREKLIVLFTDGGHEDEDQEQLEQAIAECNAEPLLHIQIVGLGGTKGVPIAIKKLSAQTRYVLLNDGEKRNLRELTGGGNGSGSSLIDPIAKRALDSNDWLRNSESGEIELTMRDDPFLTELAQKLHGSYKAVTELKQFELERLSPRTKPVAQTSQREQFAIPLSVAIVLLLLAYVSVRRPYWRAR